MGLIDCIILLLLGFDIMYLWNVTGGFNDFMFYGVIAIAILYFFMRFYLYLMLVTFDLSIRKLFKNALIFTTLGVKRNLMAILGLAVITGLAAALFPLFGATPLGIAIPIILPLLYYMAVCSFTTAYAAYPVIDRYMIAPYRNQNDEEDESEEYEGDDLSEESSMDEE